MDILKKPIVAVNPTSFAVPVDMRPMPMSTLRKILQYGRKSCRLSSRMFPRLRMQRQRQAPGFSRGVHDHLAKDGDIRAEDRLHRRV